MAGILLYRGPSMLDGSPIICIATLPHLRKFNKKTGDIVQTWIIREDISPWEAVKAGLDVSVCGYCAHRGKIVDGKIVDRSCYVEVWQAPRSVYESYHRGIYSAEWDSDTFAGLVVRLGSYGDPAAVPFHVWERALRLAAGHTGYTHQWRGYPELAAYVMASCDTPDEAAQARILGFRTFRTRLLSEPKLKGEFVCPASAEAGHKTTCNECLACGGHASKAKAHPVIVAHGAAHKVSAYKRWRAA